MRFLPLLLAFAAALPVPGLHAEPWRSALYPANWTPAFTDAEGRFLHDFSYAGYHRGERPLPQIQGPVINVAAAPYLADKTGQRDSVAAIQAALDAAAKSGGGVVLLPAGTYRLTPPEGAKVILRVRGDRTILRGEGTDKTFLFTDTPQMRDKTVILVQADAPADWHAEGGAIPFSPLAADVPNRAREAALTDVSRFQPGDLVVLRSDLTQRFIDSVEMTGKWEPAGALSRNRTLMFCRRVTAVDPFRKTLAFDVPVRYPVMVADNGRVVKIPGHTISETALEDFSIGMKEHLGTGTEENDYAVAGTLGYDVSWATAILFINAENCWVRRVNTYAPAGNAAGFHLLSNGLRLERSRLVTVENCVFQLSQYRGGGGNGYLFTMQGQENLVRNCTGNKGRHNFDFGTMAASGNVLTECTARDGMHASDFHMFLSMGNLLDHMTCDGEFLEARYFRPWGGKPVHGVTTTQSVFWNTVGLRYPEKPKFIVDSHQVGVGYVIGTQGPASQVYSNNFVEGVGRGETLEPVSLYADQLKRRISK